MNRQVLVERLYTDIEWALSQGLPPAELVPMLERLVREADAGTAHGVYARRQLAELIVRRNPFRAARLASEALATEPDDATFAVLGLAHTLLGNYGLAVKAYRDSLRLAPRSPWVAHNLGHLLDAGLGRPREALPLLERAREALPREPEIASSLAHALLAAGQRERAHQELLAAVDDDEERAEEILKGWEDEAEVGLSNGP